MVAEEVNLTVVDHSLVCTGVEFGLPGQEETDVTPAVVAEATGVVAEAVDLQMADKAVEDLDILAVIHL